MAETNAPRPKPVERFTREGDDILFNGVPITESTYYFADHGKIDTLLSLANSVPALLEQVREYEEALKLQDRIEKFQATIAKYQ